MHVMLDQKERTVYSDDGGDIFSISYIFKILVQMYISHKLQTVVRMILRFEHKNRLPRRMVHGGQGGHL